MTTESPSRPSPIRLAFWRAAASTTEIILRNREQLLSASPYLVMLAGGLLACAPAACGPVAGGLGAWLPPWHSPQASREVGLLGRADRGSILCFSSTVWHVVQARRAWLDEALVRSIWPWQLEHSCGVSGGTGSCGSWQRMHALRGLCLAGSICGKPVGRDGS